MSNLELLELYKKAQDDKKFNADKAWETIKFRTTILSTFITVTLGLLSLINSLGINAVLKSFLTAVLVIFPVIMLEIISVGETNFKRECERMYEAITIMMKIEDTFPSRGELNQHNRFPDEDKYLPRRYEEEREEMGNWKNTEEYVNDMLSSPHHFYRNMKRIFPIFRDVSYFLLSIISLWALALFVIGIANVHVVF